MWARECCRISRPRFLTECCRRQLNSSESVGGDFICVLGRQRVTVVKFRVDNRGSDGTGCFRIEVRTDTAEFTDTRITGLTAIRKFCATSFFHDVALNSMMIPRVSHVQRNPRVLPVCEHSDLYKL